MTVEPLPDDTGAGPAHQMHIGELAALTGLSLRTIRHYDEIGLLRASGRTQGGFRLYSPDDLDRLLFIRTLKPLGFSLEETGEILAVVDTLAVADSEAQPQVRTRLDEFIAAAQRRREELSRQLEMADELIGYLRSR